MSNQKNTELEKAMNNMLKGIQDTKRNQDEKLQKRLWSAIKIPFTLHEGLGTYTKNELDDIRKKLDLKNVSSLKKAELIEVLQSNIRKNLEYLCLLWDSERFNLLLDIASHGGHLNVQNIEVSQVQYIRDSGLIYSGTFEGANILAVPDDLLKSITALKNNLQLNSRINRNTEWIKLTRGLLYFYGTLALPKLIEMIEKHTNEKLNIKDYLAVVNDATSYRKEIAITEDGFSNLKVLDPELMKQEQEMRENIPFYPFTKQQLLAAGEPGFVDRNESYLQLVSFLIKNLEMSKKDADSLVGECVYATRLGESPNRIMQFMGSSLEIDNVNLLEELMDYVVDLMNNTRGWFLKGHTSMELRPKPQVQSASISDPKPNSTVTVKIGRNEPCPCESGKKYKKCCGSVVA